VLRNQTERFIVSPVYPLKYKVAVMFVQISGRLVNVLKQQRVNNVNLVFRVIFVRLVLMDTRATTVIYVICPRITIAPTTAALVVSAVPPLLVQFVLVMDIMTLKPKTGVLSINVCVMSVTQVMPVRIVQLDTTKCHQILPPLSPVVIAPINAISELLLVLQIYVNALVTLMHLPIAKFVNLVINSRMPPLIASKLYLPLSIPRLGLLFNPLVTPRLYLQLDLLLDPNVLT